jgi:hypothetical protein
MVIGWEEQEVNPIYRNTLAAILGGLPSRTGIYQDLLDLAELRRRSQHRASGGILLGQRIHYVAQ